ncbi:MAG: FecR domain-containing protein [Halioglobus sp.]
MNTQGNEHSEQARNAALGWVARLRSDAVSAEDQQSFALWLGEHRSHTQAMDEALELWDDLGAIRHLSPADELPAQSANSSRWLPAAMAAAACLVLAVFLWPQLQSDPVSHQYRSALGERRTVDLPDGSLARLNTNSSIVVTYSQDQRHIDLQHGEAWFQVRPNKQRPFHVDAGETRVTAVGTAFNVYLNNSRSTDVTVTEGVVRVSELGKTGNRAPSTELLHVNQRLIAGIDGWELSSSDDFANQLAWQRGELVAEEMPLPELVAQLERYQQTRIIIADPNVARLTVSGVLQLDQPEATLSAIAVSLGLQVTPLSDTSVLLLKAPQ